MKKILIIVSLLSLNSCAFIGWLFQDPNKVYEEMAIRKQQREQKIADEAMAYCTKLGLKDDGTLESRWYSCVKRQATANGFYNQHGRSN